MAFTEPVEVPERPKDAAPAEAPSKNALKKLEKDKAKAEKAAKRQEQDRQEKAAAEANDTSKGNYGFALAYDPSVSPQQFTDLYQLHGGKEDQEVNVKAWVANARVQSAKLAFLDLRQGVDNIQAVVAEGGANKISRQMVKWCGNINKESIVRVTGLVKQPKEPVHSTSLKNLELHIEKIYLISESAEKLPIQVKDCMRPMSEDAWENTEEDEQGRPIVSLNAKLNHRILDMRAPVNQAIFELQSGISSLFTEYMLKHRFRWIHTPKMVGAATEGGANVFEIKYFDSKAYLTQSPQFYKQMKIAGGAQRVFEIGPVFRAENSNTHRHMTEFTGLDFEMEIQDHYHEVLSFGESLMLFIIRSLQERPEYSRYIEVVQQVYPGAANFKLPPGDKAVRLTFAEGMQMLREAGHTDIGDEDDLSTPQEKALGALILSKHNTDFFTLDKFPLSLRPFYTAPDPDTPSLSNSYDFFMRGQEIMSGAQRIHSYPQLCSRMKEMGLDPDGEGFKYYTEAFKYGCSPHGGGGLGLNRILMLFLGLPDVRLATAFPRDPGRKAP